MFDFIFKKRSPLASTATQQQEKEQQQATAREISKFANKQVELSKAESLAGNEEAALAFILESSFADARLVAVKNIVNPEVLKQIHKAMRQVDRRVSKYAQEKLAELDYQQKMHLAVAECLSHGQQLLQSPHLLTNQVSLWDKERLGLGNVGSSLLAMKAELEHRLQMQFELQRHVMQVISTLGPLAGSTVHAQHFRHSLNECERQAELIRADRLVESIPKNILQQLNDSLMLAQTQSRQRQLQLQHTPAPLSEDKPQYLKPTTEPESEIESEIESKPLPDHSKGKKVQPVDVLPLVNELETALDNGSLQQALDIDKALRQTDARISGEMVSRLQTMRAELNRLLDWAKWGGNVSREELIKVADGLMHGDLTPPEIAKQVGGMRARWKELDRTSGVAGKALWERFDETCGRAYQIAEAYFKQQAQFRADNFQLASTLLTELDKVIGGLESQSSDWKAQQNYIQHVKMEWRKIGTIDRKLKTRLELEFSQKLALLSAPITRVREESIQKRRQFIGWAKGMESADRHAIDQVKQVQQQWKDEAALINLSRKEEQDLWLEFRTACDAIFAARKLNAEQQKQLRQENLLAKEACCDRLEKLQPGSSTELIAVLKQAKQAWRELSDHDRQPGLEARFSAALQRLENRFNSLLDTEKQNGLVNLRARIRLCQQIESARSRTTLADDAVTARQGEMWKSEWNALVGVKSPLLTSALVKLMAQRFNAAMTSFKTWSDPATNTNASNLTLLEEKLLRVEILRGLPSPPELTQQRMQLQVKDLQSAMKNRDVSENYLNNFHTLCALPVNLNAQLEERFHKILDNYCESFRMTN